MNNSITFDDVLIVPKFSSIKSRKDVDIKTEIAEYTLQIPVISANMDTVTGSAMSRAMLKAGGMACLHRFCSIEDNVKMFEEAMVDWEDFVERPWVSVGLGDKEVERAKALDYSGANVFVVDVAHGASMEVVNQVKKLRSTIGKYNKIIVGNFATKNSINDFLFQLGDDKVDAFKVGIGGGSACTTRIVTGVGIPTLSSVLDCVKSGYPIIADGGIRNSGDICKAIASGAKAVMVGRMLAGCDESPSEPIYEEYGGYLGNIIGKRYRGSASQESYVVQNKIAEWRSAEGESMVTPYTGKVERVLQQIEGGLRSSMSYVGANTIKEYQDNAEFVMITNASVKENSAHGKS